MKIILLTQGQVATVSNKDFKKLSNYRWWAVNVRGKYYAQTKIGGRNYYMHQLVKPKEKGKIHDHINSDGLQNQRSNLRLITYQQNAWNKSSDKGARSKYKGVSLLNGKWRASITTDKYILLGRYNTQKEAAARYNKAATKYFKQFAYLNDI